MAHVLHDDVLDALLTEIADNGDKLFCCSATPTDYTEASVTYALADHDLVVGDGNGDYAIANGAVDGRKLTVAEQAAITVDSTGTVTHLAICDSGNTKVLAVVDNTDQAVVAANTVTVSAITITVPDPT